MDSATHVISYDSSNTGRVEFYMYASGWTTSSYGIWASPGCTGVTSGAISFNPCESEVFTDTNSHNKSPSIYQTFQLGDPSATFVVSFTSFTATPTKCAPRSYFLPSTSTSGLTLDSAAKTITVDDSTAPLDYTFTV